MHSSRRVLSNRVSLKGKSHIRARRENRVSLHFEVSHDERGAWSDPLGKPLPSNDATYIHSSVAVRLRETRATMITSVTDQFGALPPRGSERPPRTHVRHVGTANRD